MTLNRRKVATAAGLALLLGAWWGADTFVSPASEGASTLSERASDPASAQGRSQRPAAGERIRSAPPPEVTLTRGLTARLQGRVSNPAGEPVEGAWVRWIPSFCRELEPWVSQPAWMRPGAAPADAPPWHAASPAAFTDPDGTFELRMPPEEFTCVVAGAPGHSVWRDWIGDAERDKEDSTPYRINPTLHPAGGISGRVLDADSGDPVAGVEVCLFEDKGSPRDTFGIIAKPRRAVSDAAGRWRLDGVPAGQWRPLALPGRSRTSDVRTPTEAPLFSIAANRNIEDVVLTVRYRQGEATVLLTDDRGEPLAGRNMMLVPSFHDASGLANQWVAKVRPVAGTPPGEYRFVGLPLPFRGTFGPGCAEPVVLEFSTPRARVRCVIPRKGALSGVVVDESGTLLPGMPIELERPDRFGFGKAPERRLRTDLGGVFRADDLAPGEMTVRLGAAVPLEPEARPAVQATIRPAEETSVRLQLDPAARRAAEESREEGPLVVLVRRDGTPVADMEVTVETASGEKRLGTTDVAGRVTFPLPHGHTVVASAGDWPRPVTAEDRTPQGSPLVLELPPSAALALAVRLPNGVAASRWQYSCRVYDFIGPQARRFSPTGETARCPDLAPGEHTVWVHAAGCMPERRTVTLAAGEVRELTIQLQPGATLHGRVVDAGGEAIAGAEVVLAPKALSGVEYGEIRNGATGLLSTSPRATTDPAGAYRFSDLPAGPARLLAFHREHGVSATHDVTLSSDTRAPDTVLHQEASVGGTVYRDGVPLAARWLYTTGACGFQQGVSDAQGRYRLSGLRRGTCYLSSSARDVAQDSTSIPHGPVDVRPGEETERDLHIQPGVTVTVTFTAPADGDGLNAALLAADAPIERGEQALQSTVDLSDLTAHEVPPGRYVVMVRWTGDAWDEHHVVHRQTVEVGSAPVSVLVDLSHL